MIFLGKTNTTDWRVVYTKTRVWILENTTL